MPGHAIGLPGWGFWTPKPAPILKSIFKIVLHASPFLNTFKTSTHLCRETLRQVDVPEVVQRKMKEFIDQQKQKKG